MSKKQKNNKALLWVLLAAALLVIAVASLILVMVFPKENQQTETQYESKLYWNVERARYVSQGYYGVSSRIPDSDGYYHVNMAVDGEQTEVLVADVNLINRMDFEEVMGLTFDENGIVNGIMYLEEFTGGIAADKYAVVSVNGNTVVCNTSAKYRGLDVTYELTDETGIWLVGDFEAMVGMPTAISEGDQVLMIRDREGNISDVYVFPFVPPGDVYWNITRMWDSTSQTSTRERDGLGCFVYDFVINGEIKTLRTKNQDVANLIDNHASQAMGLVFDDNGDIIEVLNAGNNVCGGGLLCNRYLVTAVQDGQFTVKSGANTYETSISKDCKFFDVSGNGRFVGEPIDGIQLGDRVTVLKDRRDQACVIYVTNRMTTDDIYWVVERNEVWNRTTWTTDRKPASDGWYYIKLAGNGKQITVKSRDDELVNKLDSYVCWCVKLDGDEIVSIQDATNRYGGSLFGAFNKLLTIDGNKLTIQKTSNTATAIMADDCIVYNVSTSSIQVGEHGKLREGDTIYGFTDIEGVVRYVFVTSTTFDGEIYWNMTRMYDTEKKVTTRERADDGYYYFEMVCNGKVVWLKTADKEIATKVDLVRTRARGLKLSGDVILDVLAPEKLTKYPGVKPDVSWKGITQISGNKITVNDNGKAYSFKLASGCKIYNVSGVYENAQGEITTLREGDYIVTLVNEYDQAVIVYVCGGRKKTFNTKQESCPCNSGVVWQKWDGKKALSSGYYYLTKDVTAPAGGWVLDGAKVYLRLDGHSITSQGRAFMVKSGATLSICDHISRGKLIGTGSVNESGGLIQITNSNVTVNLFNIDIHAEGMTAENGGAISVSGWLSMYNVNVYGGAATKKGGNIAVMPTGNFRMFGGELKNGSAAVDGSNLFIVGNAYLENVIINGGVSASVADKQFIIHGAQISQGDYGVDLLSGELVLSGDVKILDNKAADLRIAQDCYVKLNRIGQAAKVSVEMAKAGVFCKEAEKKDSVIFVTTDPEMSVVHTDKGLCLRAKHSHSLYSGAEEIGFTKLTQSMFDQATESSVPVSIKGANYVLAGGSYYLSQNISIDKQILVYDEVDLCLNGKSLTAQSSRTFALTGALMNVTDCAGEGSIVGGTAGNAANILLQGSKGGANGEVSVLNLYAGTLIGGTANASNGGHGGNVQVYLGAMNMYGGTLTGGTAKACGGTVYVNAGQKLNLYGGQITAGSAALGNCIAMGADAAVTLDGLVLVDEIYLSDQLVYIDQLQEGSSVGIFAEKAGVIANAVGQDVSSMFVCGEDNAITFDSVNHTLSYSFAHTHCVCNGFEGHECSQQAWMGLTEADLLNGNYKPEAGIHYYLKEDVQLNSHLVVSSQKTLNLCLNGHKITAPASARVFVLNGGTLNLTDCGETGTLVATKATTGGAILVQGNGGGATGAYMGTLNLYGGTIQGGQVTQGGAVAVTGGTMNLYGGTLAGGTAKTNGGTLYVEKGQKLNLYGGQITSGTAAVGACLYADLETTVTLNGIGVLEAVYLNGTQLVVESVTDDFTTQISAAAGGVLIQNIEEAVAAKFTAAPENTLTYDPEAKTLSLTVPVQYEHGHCICDEGEGHGCSIIEWTGLTAADLMAGNYVSDASHYYYLTEDVNLKAAITVFGGSQLNLCLNGKTVTAPASTRALVVNGGVVNITDCQDTGTLIGAGTKNGGTVYIQAGKGSSGQVNLYGGTIQGTKCANGGAVYIADGCLNVYGGIIRGAEATNAAGAVFVAAKQSLNVFGGQITAGSAGTKACCVLVVAGATVTVGDNAQVEEIYLNKTVKLYLSEEHPLKETARVGIRMDAIGVFMDSVESYIDGTFICRNTDKVIYWDPESKKLSVSEPVSDLDTEDQ